VRINHSQRSELFVGVHCFIPESEADPAVNKTALAAA
jgi:hypothetical protein